VGFEPGPEDSYTEGAEVTRSGRLFQTQAAATGKLGHRRYRQSGAADNQWWGWTGPK